MRRITAIATSILALVALPLTVLTTQVAPARAANDDVIHVSASASPGGDGSADSPYATISEAVEAAPDGSTIEVGDGTYREGEIKADKSVTIRAAEGAAPVLSGAEVPASWTASDGTWSTPADMVRFCTVCTTNPDPSAEGMAAHPEQVFVDGEPLTQVASREEVTESTFYVDDDHPVTLEQPGNNRAGFNTAEHRGASYVIGVDPSQHTVEVSQHSRALTLLGDHSTLEGLDVEKYSPVQEWSYEDPDIGGDTGGVMVFASGAGLKVSGNTFKYSGGGTALGLTSARDATVSNNTITDNAGVGMGINQGSNIDVENNTWSGNNSAGFITTGCGGYCTLADMKVTHAEKVRYAYNTVDYSQSDTDHSDASSWESNRLAGIWFDEGVIDSQIVASHFVNVPMAIFTEVSRGDIIASNVIEGAGIGIQVAGSENNQVWNNTISHALTSISVYEDTRSDGCNARGDDGSCTLPERWSMEHGLTWDTVGTGIYNNIMSSEQTATDGDVWRYSAMVQVTGDKNADGSGAVYANDMISGIDYNVYYRQPTSQPSTTILWQYGEDRKTQSLNAESLADFSNSPDVTVEGREAHGLDLQGERDANPVLVSESSDPTAWKTSDLHVAPDGPAADSGTQLTQDVADALGISESMVVDRGALVNAAWEDGGQTPTGADGQDQHAATDDASGQAAPASGDDATTTPDGSAATQAGEESTRGVLTGGSSVDGTGAAAPGGRIAEGQSGTGGQTTSGPERIIGYGAVGLGTLTLLGAVAYAVRTRLL